MADYASIQKQQNKNKIFIWTCIIFIVAINILASMFHAQWDLTQDKRFTITENTQKMLQQLDGKAVVQVFLDGDNLPEPSKHLQKATEDILKGFANFSHQKVSYFFTNPLSEDTAAFATLRQYHMVGYPIIQSDGAGGNSQQMVYPWALVKFYPAHPVSPQDSLRVYPVFLQQANTSTLSRTILNKSEILLEYNIGSIIHKLSMNQRSFVAYLTGNQEPFGKENFALFRVMGSSYNVDTVNINSVNALDPKYKVVVINDPRQPFSEIQKFKIDQYLMNGGNIIWSVNEATGNIDSFNDNGSFTALKNDLNLNDLFFSEGFRINADLVLDAADNSGIVMSVGGNDPNPQMAQWPYYPVIKPTSNHPIVKNMEGVVTRIMSSIDTISGNPNVSKTILLATSKYTKKMGLPQAVIYESALETPNPAAFNSGTIIGGLLLEGGFSSLYSAHIPEDVLNFVEANHIKILKQSTPNSKMLVVSDGDLFKNEVASNGAPKEMGIYRFANFKFDNENFINNSLEYMIDSNNLLQARNKDFQVRILDPKVIQEERGKWQFINIVIPAVSILLFGGIFIFIRKKKYAK